MNEKDTRYYENIICELKTPKRGQTVMTVLVDLVVPINNTWYMNFELTEKSSSNVFSNTVINNTIEVCRAMSDGSSLPPIIKLGWPLVQKFAPKFFHKCPYLPTPRMGAESLTLEVSLIPLLSLNYLQHGEYRSRVVSFNKHGEIMFWVNYYARLTQKSYQRKKTTTASKNNLP